MSETKIQMITDQVQEQIDALRSIAQTNANNIAQRASYQAVAWGKELTSNLAHGILIINHDAIYVFWYAGNMGNMAINYRFLCGTAKDGITFTVLNKYGQGDLWKVTLPSNVAMIAIGREY